MTFCFHETKMTKIRTQKMIYSRYQQYDFSNMKSRANTVHITNSTTAFRNSRK